MGNTGIVLVGPAACVGGDNRTIIRTVGFCGVPPRGIVMVFSSVSLSIKGVHVHSGNDSNNREKVHDVVCLDKDSGFPHVGINVNTGPGPS